MQRYPRHEVIRICLAFMSMGELHLAVLQRLALQATRADYASGNDHPSGVPVLNPSFTVHLSIPSWRGTSIYFTTRYKLSGTLKTIPSNEGWPLWR